MRTVIFAALVAVVLSACGGDDVAIPPDGGSGAAAGHAGAGGHAGAAGGTGGSGGRPADASSDRATTTGGGAGAGMGGSGGGSEASIGDGDGSAQIDAPADVNRVDGTIESGGGDVSVADRSDAPANDAPADVSVSNDGGSDAVSEQGVGEEPQCGVPNDCPSPGNECLVATCVDGGCGTAPVALGTAVAAQVAGDCKRKVCDGHGGTQDQNDDADISDDSNVCTVDGCSNGTPTHVAQMGMMCGTNGLCNSSGACVGCNVPADCPGPDDFCKTRKCENGICGFTFTLQATALPAGRQTTGDCQTKACDGNGGVEDDPTPSDVVADTNPCTKDLCDGTTPTHPPEDVGTVCSAGGGQKCDGAGSCVQCLAPADCGNPAGFPCVVATCSNAHQCGTASASPDTLCGQGPSCTSAVGHLQDKCDGSGTCVPGASPSCAPFACGATACNTSCGDDNGCASPNVCDVGIQRCIGPTDPKCTDYCNTIQPACINYVQYPSATECLHTCADLPRTDAVSTNTVTCRLLHAGYASGPTGDPSTHCPHAGPAGDGVCGANCESFCAIAANACTGANQQYATIPDCMTACNLFAMTPPRYTLSVVTGNTFPCRMYHLTLASVDPITHCPHIAPVSATCF